MECPTRGTKCPACAIGHWACNNHCLFSGVFKCQTCRPKIDLCPCGLKQADLPTKEQRDWLYECDAEVSRIWALSREEIAYYVEMHMPKDKKA